MPPPTKTVETVGRSGPSVARGAAQLGDRGAGVLGAVGAGAELVGGVGVEVAVAAAGRAERHVHVEPERRRRSGPRARDVGQLEAAAAGVSSSGRTVFICSQCAAPRATARQDAAVTSDRVVQVDGVARRRDADPGLPRQPQRALPRAARPAARRRSPTRSPTTPCGWSCSTTPAGCSAPGMDLAEAAGGGAQDQGVREFPDLLEAIWTLAEAGGRRRPRAGAGRRGRAAGRLRRRRRRRRRRRSRSPRCGSGWCRR